MMERPDDNESLPSMSGRAELRAVRRTVAQEEPRHADSGPQPAFSRSAHVLAVDDDPAMRAMIADYLVDQNVRVSVPADSREMQRVLAAGAVHLVILPLQLGIGDAPQLLPA